MKDRLERARKPVIDSFQEKLRENIKSFKFRVEMDEDESINILGEELRKIKDREIEVEGKVAPGKFVLLKDIKFDEKIWFMPLDLENAGGFIAVVGEEEVWAVSRMSNMGTKLFNQYNNLKTGDEFSYSTEAGELSWKILAVI